MLNEVNEGWVKSEIRNPKSEFPIRNGGEDRTRTCKRFPAVVFKTTALPIRLPLRAGRRDDVEIRIYRTASSDHNPSFAQKKAPAVKFQPG